MMSHATAMILLDQCRAGQNIPLALINQALELTGDLDHMPCSLADA